jgi:predicted nuclease with TOPRIM domain
MSEEESENSEFSALAGLEDVIKHVSEELASWRKRALKAEGDRTGLGADHDVVSMKERVVSLEGQNAELDRRLDAARGRVQDLVKRLRFLEEQAGVTQGATR